LLNNIPKRKKRLGEYSLIKGLVALAFFGTCNAFGFEFPTAKPEAKEISSDRLERVSAETQGISIKI